jgi:hypothetical protein
LDVFFVRFPFGQPEINGPAWQGVDEQHFSADCRRRLLSNGFRAGILAGQLPSELSELLELAGQQKFPGEIHNLQANNLAHQPKVMRGHFQLRAGAQKEFALGQYHEQLPILLCDSSGKVSGKTYSQVRPMFVAKAHPLADGRVRLELVPKITHGKYSQRWATDTQGALRLDPGHESITFDDMKLEATLSPGHMLLLSTIPSRQGSLGSHFFSETHNGTTQQTLLLVRLTQTQHDGEFDRQVDLVIE